MAETVLRFNVWSERKRVEKLRYTHRNPVKRGLCRSRNGITTFCGACEMSRIVVPFRKERERMGHPGTVPLKPTPGLNGPPAGTNVPAS